jgi:hypothetical protein
MDLLLLLFVLVVPYDVLLSRLVLRVLELVEVEETLNPDDRGTEPYRAVFVSPGIL